MRQTDVQHVVVPQKCRVLHARYPLLAEDTAKVQRQHRRELVWRKHVT